MSPVMFLGSGSGKAIPQYIGAQYLDYTSGSTLSYPAGSQNGDLIVIFATCTVASAAPTGFAEQASRLWSGYGYYTYVWTKFVSGDSSCTIPNLGTGAAICACVRGVSSIGAVGTHAQSAGSTVSVPAITLTSELSLTLGYCSDRDPVGGTPPGGWTSTLTWSGTSIGWNMATRAFGITGSSGNQTWNQYNGSYDAVGSMIELVP